MRFRGTSSADNCENATGAVIDNNCSALKVGRIPFLVPVGSLLMLITGSSFDCSQPFFHRPLSGLLEIGIKGGVDDQATVLNVFSFENFFEIPADGIESVASGNEALGGTWNIERFFFRGFGLLFSEVFKVDHAVENGVSF